MTMYKPCVPRKKKTSIVRTRTGCSQCRTKRRKCDEAKPTCRRCARQGVTCNYAPRLSFVDTNDVTRKRVEDVEKRKWASIHEEEATSDPGESSLSGLALARKHDQLPSPRLTGDEAAPARALRHVESRPLVIYQGNPQTTSPYSGPSGSPKPSWASGTASQHDSDISTSPDALSSRSTVPTFNYRSGLPLVRLADRKYLIHFNNRVSNLMPSVFSEVKSMIMQSLTLRNSVLALSAADLASLHAENRLVTRGGTLKTRLTLHPSHQQQCISYYGSAIRLFSHDSADNYVSPTVRLICAILMAFFEMESGTPRGFFAHVSGADAIVAIEHQSISRTEMGRVFLACWATLHARQGHHRLPFRTLDVERGLVSPASTASRIKQLASTFADRTGTILTILGDSYRINQRIHFERCMRMDGEDTLATLQRSAKWYTEAFCFPFSSEEENKSHRELLCAEDLVLLMAAQRSKLDSWHNSLASHELPQEEWPPPKSASASHSRQPEIAPFHFQSFDTAMNYIFYATAQLMSCEDVLKLSEPGQPNVFLEQDRSSYWARVILRAVNGINFGDTGINITYNIDIPEVLLYLSQFCSEPPLIEYILSRTLPRLEAEVSQESFKLHLTRYRRQILLVYNAISEGRHVLLLHPNDNMDAEQSGLTDYYPEMRAAIHGKEADGSFFNEFVSLP